MARLLKSRKQRQEQRRKNRDTHAQKNRDTQEQRTVKNRDTHRIEDHAVSWHFYLFQCTKVIDCLDSKNSEITYMPWEPEEIVHIKDSVFIPECLPKTGLFVVPEKWDIHIYVTEVFW